MQTRNIAKNTFSEGLVLDFAPDNTQANVLTNALNATLLTFNGNEMSLQNDMGNCRVESAYLPEGYVPVGTCEFGDIIYIVSYNPLENKSQIGCFPSPERNISNKEVSDLEQVIRGRDLALQGKINSSSIKRIIYGNSNINAGDKFIISWGPKDSEDPNKNYISNYGNTNHSLKLSETYQPKLTKVHVVSIDDSGNVKYLDDSVKWYDNDFIISNKNFDTTKDNDLLNVDSYRHALQCAYSVFQSKVSGKLALLLELETINNFSCGHKVIKRHEGSDEYYDIYLSASWETDNYNINPMGMLVTNSIYANMSSYKEDKLNYNGDPYDLNRVVYFSRLYEMENPGSYGEFLTKNSFYKKIDNYKLLGANTAKFTVNDTKGALSNHTTLIDNILLTYEKTSDKARIPSAEGNLNKYVANPIKSISYNGNITYKTSINKVDYTTNPTLVEDDVVVNYFKKSVLKKVGCVKRKLVNTSTDPCTITYTVCPCMPYGPLTHLGITNTIDFNSRETGEVNLNTWKYYVNDKSVTLNFGFDTYLRESEDEVIDKIIMEFYDNVGLCATYELSGQETYNGKFTEYIELNEAPTNFRFTALYLQDTDTNRKDHLIIAHPNAWENLTFKDLEDRQEGEYVYKSGDTWTLVPTDSLLHADTKVYRNNAGILYSGRPYLVKIKICKGRLDELGNINIDNSFTTIEYYRWLWTNRIMNDFYYQDIADFNDSRVEIPLDYTAIFDGGEVNNLKETFTYFNPDTKLNQEKFKSLGAQIDLINRNNIPNIKFYGYTNIANTYNDTIFLCQDKYKDIKVFLGIADKSIETSETSTVYEQGFLGNKEELYPVYKDDFSYNISNLGNNFYPAIKSYQSPGGANIYDYNKAFLSYTDGFNLEITGISTAPKTTTIKYINSKKVEKSAEVNLYETNALNWSDKKIKLSLQGIKYNKIMADSVKESNEAKVLEPLITSREELNLYGIDLSSSGKTYFSRMAYIGLVEGGGNTTGMTLGYLKYTDVETASFLTVYNEDTKKNRMYASIQDSIIKNNLGSDLCISPFIPVLIGNSERPGKIDEIVLSVAASKLTETMGKGSFGANQKKHVVGKNPVYPNVKRQNETNKFLPGTPPFLHNESRDIFCSMGIVTTSGDIYLTADASLLTANDGKNKGALVELPQTIIWKKNGVSSPSTIADAYSALLLQLFTVKDSTKTFPILKDIARLSDFTETWKANVFIQLSKGDNYSANDYSENSSCALLSIFPMEIKDDSGKTCFGMNLQSYVKSILDNSGIASESEYTSKVNPSNINPKITDGQGCIEMIYNLPYSIDRIEPIYQEKQISSYYLLQSVYNSSDKGSIKATYIPITTPIDDTKLYTYLGNNTVAQFSPGSKFETISEFLEMAASSENSTPAFIVGFKKGYPLDVNPYSGLCDAISYDGRTIRVNDIEKLQGNHSTYYVQVDASGDDPRITDLRAINLFNYGKFI